MATEPQEPVVTTRDPSHLSSGPGRVIVALYAVMALAATGRSSVQIAEYFGRAPFAYVMSAAAAVVYLIATVALVTGGRRAVRIALVSASVELVGVLVIGTLSYVVPSWFPDKTVWSHFGQGYGYVPLVLPILGLWWLRRFLPGRA
ncbi:putative integral membrane protein [Nostocoides japonicum T1-X7]|uniref:Putative integral membrane protein n=1 Tax=Nostocoides japonicum T1-X7 TaxID=1194083 RepID=A0A077LWQ5_9MICO|nr:hypothetical protein [Tetrasphaera japonica]CCH78131.1 putative integral membrane protein [Tetrasphaera japonica T1-X7]